MLRFLTKAAPTGMPPALSSVRPALAKSDGGSAFLDLFLPSLRNQGLEGPPHRVPGFLACCSPRNPTSPIKNRRVFAVRIRGG
jgi:hypothetical protein